MIFVPNTELATNKITNFSCEDLRRVDNVFRAGYNNDPQKVIAALNDAVTATPNQLIDPAPFGTVSGS